MAKNLNCNIVFVVLVAVVLMVLSSFAASPGAGDTPVNPQDDRGPILQNTVLLMETIDTTNTIQLVLNNLGIPFDLVSSGDWTAIDYSPYEIVIVGMDGGSAGETEIQTVRTEVIDAGKRLCFVGGGASVGFVTGLNNSIIGIDVVNYSWAMSASPHFTLTNPGHFLAEGLPAQTDFVNGGATYYMARMNDADMAVIATNGDGWPSFVSKRNNFPGGGSGDFRWFTSVPASAYWSDSTDFSFFEQMITNVISDEQPLFADDFELGDTLGWDGTVGLDP